MPSNFKALAGASGGEPIDANFKNVTLLLHGDGSNGAQNNTFLDSSTNNFTITRNGNTTQGSFSPYGSNWSNYFDGTGDYLETPSSSAAGLTGDWTVEAWVFPTSFAAANGLFDCRSGGTGFAIYYNLTGFAGGAGSMGYATNSALVAYSAAVINLNAWNHIAVVRSGNTVTGYANGSSVFTYTETRTNATTTTYQIGVPSAIPLGYFSNMRVVRGTAIYSGSTITVPTAPLTAITNTSLLTCQSNRFRDASTNNFTITRNGDVKVTNFAPFAPSAAYSTTTNGGSGYFDGTGDYLQTPSSSALAVGTGDFTLECWVYATSAPSDIGIYEGRSGGAATDGFTLTAFSSSVIRIYAGGVVVASSGTNYVGGWVHVAVTRASGTTTLWINGVSQGTSSTSYNCTNTDAVVGGGRYSAGSSVNTYFPGYISNFRIVKGTAVYTASFTPPSSPVTAITNTSLLLNATNAAIFDNSMKNDLETVGNAQISTSVKKFGTGSMAFDGTGDWLQLPSTSELSFGTGNFTIEMWMYAQNLASIPMLFHKGSSGSNGWFCQTSASTLYFGQLDSARYSTWSVSLSNNTWYHIALTRVGSTLNVFINGVSQTAQTVSGADTSNDNTSPALIGVIAGGTYALQGYLDDYRITKGVARYTANFTPPTAAFPNK